MIPGEKKPLVGGALREAFDVTEFEEIQMLTAGLSSALVFRIVVCGCPYLLRNLERRNQFGGGRSEAAVCAGAHESEFARDAFGAI